MIVFLCKLCDATKHEIIKNISVHQINAQSTPNWVKNPSKNSFFPDGNGVFGGKDNYAIQVLSSAKVGDIVQPDLGYSFLTANKSYAKDYTSSCEGIKDPENSLMMIIKAPIGTPISRDFAFDRSIINSNVVLARGANFEVLDKKVKDGTTYITLKYLNCATDRGE